MGGGLGGNYPNPYMEDLGASTRESNPAAIAAPIPPTSAKGGRTARVGGSRFSVVGADAEPAGDESLGRGKFELIPPSETLTERDLAWMVHIWITVENLQVMSDFFREWTAGRFGIYRLRNGICILQVIDNAEKELSVYAMGGKGILSDLPEIVASMKEEARKFGCKTIGGLAHRPGLIRAYKRLGMREVSTLMRMDV